MNCNAQQTAKAIKHLQRADNGWSVNFDTSQGIDAVVGDGGVLDYRKKRNKTPGHEKKPDLFR